MGVRLGSALVLTGTFFFLLSHIAAEMAQLALSQICQPINNDPSGCAAGLQYGLTWSLLIVAAVLSLAGIYLIIDAVAEWVEDHFPRKG